MRATGARGVLLLSLLAGAMLAGACSLSLGRSVEQRDIPLHTIGSGPNAVLLIGGLHTGSEDNSRIIAEQLAAYFQQYPHLVPPSVTLYIVPSANPDGTALGIHTNANRVDLNRNWPADDWVADACHPATGCHPGLGGPSPLSEPETQALYRFIETKKPKITLVWHAEAPLVESNEAPHAERFGRVFAAAAGYDYIEEWTAYRITGQLIDALEQRLGLAAFDVELSQCCEISQDELERNAYGVVALLREVARDPGDPSRDRSPTPTATPRGGRARPTPRPIDGPLFP